MSSHHRGIGFLLSLGCLPLACGENEPGESSATTDDLPADADPVCVAYGKQLDSCAPDISTYQENALYNCSEILKAGKERYGPACADAIEAFYVCLTMRSCAELDEELCEAESYALDDACPGLLGTD